MCQTLRYFYFHHVIVLASLDCLILVKVFSSFTPYLSLSLTVFLTFSLSISLSHSLFLSTSRLLSPSASTSRLLSASLSLSLALTLYLSLSNFLTLFLSFSVSDFQAGIKEVNSTISCLRWK